MTPNEKIAVVDKVITYLIKLTEDMDIKSHNSEEFLFLLEIRDKINDIKLEQIQQLTFNMLAAHASWK